MASIFTRIINREIPGYIVAEDDRFIAFLDINPLAKGHTLVVPKEEVDYIFDMDDRSLADLMLFAKEVANRMRKVIPCERIGVAVIGLEVPHAHVHLVPLKAVSDIDFSRPKMQLLPEELQSFADMISKA